LAADALPGQEVQSGAHLIAIRLATTYRCLSSPPREEPLVQQSGVARARQLLARAEPDLVAVGRLVRAARIRGDFKAFCAAVKLGPRKAYDLIAIANAVEAGRLQSTDVQEIGWAKARLIAEQAATKSKARRALTFARKNTLPALFAYFQGNGAKISLVTKSFHLTVQQA
jgi:hypothetical protein